MEIMKPLVMSFKEAADIALERFKAKALEAKGTVKETPVKAANSKQA
jgi:hypothetical protein